MRVLFSNGAEVSLYVRVLNSIIHLGSHYAGFDEEEEDDPAEIHQAMALPGHPVNLTPGHNPQDSKRRLVVWTDNIIRRYVGQRVDVFDVDEEGEKLDGSYGGLRSGERSRVVAFLTSRGMRRWQQDIFSMLILTLVMTLPLRDDSFLPLKLKDQEDQTLMQREHQLLLGAVNSCRRKCASTVGKQLR